MRQQSNAKASGTIFIVSSRETEMMIFDKLDPALQHALNHAKLQFSAAEVQKLIDDGEMTPAEIIRFLSQ